MRQRLLAIPLVLLLAVTLLGCDNEAARAPNRANFLVVVNDFLAQRGHLCLAKYDWPIRIAFDSSESDARQLPVLEKLGLVVSTGTRITHRDANGAMQLIIAHEYALTALGRQYYLHVPIVIRTATRNISHPADLCAATLTLNRLIGWDPPVTRAGRTATSLLFSYHIKPAAWARTPEVLHAFPVLARAIENEGSMQVRLGVHLTPYGWVADELGDQPPHEHSFLPASM